MPARLHAAAADFEERFRATLGAKREVPPNADAVVRGIPEDVRERGDAALTEYTQRFDGLVLTPETLRLDRAEIAEAFEATDATTREALEFAPARIDAHHERRRPGDNTYVNALGVVLGSRWTAIESVGLYVPGGAASYPSSVLMNAVPAKVAGVERIAMVVPARAGELNPLVLAAAHVAGINDIYRIGGAQAVAAAKRQVSGTVGIDMIAGRSEVLTIADGANDAAWIAADLLAQAEHDAASQSILVTDDPALADAVEAAIDGQLALLGRRGIAMASCRDFGAIILVPDPSAAPALANRIAAEPLELAVADPDTLFAKIRNAGAAFLGRHTPEAIGDCVGGSHDVPPTARSARFSSGLSVLDFVKRTSILKLGVEGIDAHARSVSIRLTP